MKFLGALSACRVFQQVDSAVVCLLQQPQAKPYVQSRSWEPFSRCCKCHVSLQRSTVPTRHSSFPSFLQYTGVSEACWAVRKLSFINQAHVLLGFTGCVVAIHVTNTMRGSGDEPAVILQVRLTETGTALMLLWGAV